MYLTKLIVFLALVPAPAIGTVFLERSTRQQHAKLSDVCIGYMTLEGPISNGKQFKQGLEQLMNHPLVQGIILTINSGGGSVTASWEIFEAIKRVNAQKPIISYVEEVCASGAYLAACATTKIVANPMATVGSIGVVRTVEELQPTEFKQDGLKGKVIIHRFKKGKFKQLGSSFDPMTDEDKEQLNKEVDFIYQQFCNNVATYRGLSLEQVEAQHSLSFTGIEALELGLIDTTGSFDDALTLLARELATRGVTISSDFNLKESMLMPD